MVCTLMVGWFFHSSNRVYKTVQDNIMAIKQIQKTVKTKNKYRR